MKSYRSFIHLSLALILLFSSHATAQNILESFDPLIKNGDFSQAQTEMWTYMADHPDMNPLDRMILEFEVERLDRIRKDFTKTRADVVDYIRKYIPGVSDDDLERWEKEKSLEAMIIDGKKWYFYRSAPNLFRIDKKAKAIKKAYEDAHSNDEEPLYSYVEDAAKIIHAARTLGSSLVNPIRFRMTYTLSVDADVVPPGEIIRAWLPYPKDAPPRQVDVKFITSSPDNPLIADNNISAHRTVYLEKETVAGERTEFQAVYEYTSYAQFYDIDPKAVLPYNTHSPSYKKYTGERAPHIQFSKTFKSLLPKIIGNETNPYLKARKIFQWVYDNVPWAGAREYSTIRNIPKYCIDNGHGDCGIQTMTFMTLARLAGIPVRWQSGWWVAPGQKTLHDWGEFYLEPYGWLLVDQYCGVQASKDENVKWFALGGTDAWRFIVNTDYSRPFYPAKIYPRSETVDFQRGEVEWRGGNLYFDLWGYSLKVEVIE